MPRKRIPTNVLELRGSLKGRPQRRAQRDGEPLVSEPVGNPPASLSDSERACWMELAEQAPTGVLTRADRIAVEMGALLVHRLRLEGAATPPALLLRLHCILACFVMTPADRSRVNVQRPVKPSVSKFDD